MAASHKRCNFRNILVFVILLSINTTLYLRVDSWLSITTRQPVLTIASHNNTIDTTSLLNIKPVSHNLLPYYKRCVYKPEHEYLPPGMDEFGAMHYGILSKVLLYQHVFKAGGTTIMSGIKSLIRDQKMLNLTKITKKFAARTQLKKNSILISSEFETKYKGLFRDEIDKYVDKDALIFTFIRDPLSKTLSAFYEINWRAYFGETNLQKKIYRYRLHQSLGISAWWKYTKIDAMEAFQRFIKRIYRLTRQVTNVTAHKKNYFTDHYIDTHFAPNLFFLMHNGQQNKSLKYNFIGNLDNLSKDLPQLLNGYLIDDELKYNDSLLMEQYFSHQRDRNDTKNDEVFHNEKYLDAALLYFDRRYNLKISQLKDDYVKLICEIYWMDYLCFPFNLLSQCNLTYLMDKHYGIDLQLL